MRVLVTGARAPVAIDLARSFRAAGVEVELADSVTPFAARLIRPRMAVSSIPSPRWHFALFRSAMAEISARFDLIVPTCEEVFWMAEAASRDGWSEKLFAPSPSILRTLHSKADFPVFARSLGVDAPRTVTLSTPADLACLPLSLSRTVFKPEFSRFGARTIIAPPGLPKRLRPSTGARWVAQELVEGEELCVWSAARAGRLVACAIYRPVLRHGRAASYAFEAVDAPSVKAMAESIAAAVGTGQLSYDVVVAPDGRIAPVECNPRAVSGLHLMDATPDLAAAFLGGPGAPDPIPGTLRFLSPAMAVLGVSHALASGAPMQLASTWSRGRDVVGRPGDRLPVAGVLLDAARFALLGITRIVSPTGATTDDIEWNGEAMV